VSISPQWWHKWPALTLPELAPAVCMLSLCLSNSRSPGEGALPPRSLCHPNCPSCAGGHGRHTVEGETKHLMGFLLSAVLLDAE
jgi:hypothetical protein